MLENSPFYRFLIWVLASVLALTALYCFAPAQLPVVLYKLALVVLAITLAYWLDRAMFPYARPHQFFGWAKDLLRCSECDKHDVEAAYRLRVFASIASLRRVIIILACVLGLTLGL